MSINKYLLIKIIVIYSQAYYLSNRNHFAFLFDKVFIWHIINCSGGNK